MKNYILKFKIIISLSAIFVLLPVVSFAANLYLDPAEGEYYQGDTFIAKIRIDNEEECINTVEANLTFPPDILEAVDFSEADSILAIWLKKPEVGKGMISFIGGIPGGYCGKLPGDPGEIGLLVKIVFKVKSQDSKTAKVDFKDSRVFLNDSFGTEAGLITRGAVFSILSGIVKTPKEEWKEEIEKDIIPPEPFEITINQDESVFDNRYFLVFSAADKQTGIDNYEIKEGISGWKEAESPYLLEDQSLKSIIKVKAIDKAGNERIAEYSPAIKTSPLWLIVIILIGIFAWLFYNRFLQNK